MFSLTKWLLAVWCVLVGFNPSGLAQEKSAAQTILRDAESRLLLNVDAVRSLNDFVDHNSTTDVEAKTVRWNYDLSPEKSASDGGYPPVTTHQELLKRLNSDPKVPFKITGIRYEYHREYQVKDNGAKTIQETYFHRDGAQSIVNGGLCIILQTDFRPRAGRQVQYEIRFTTAEAKPLIKRFVRNGYEPGYGRGRSHDHWEIETLQLE